MKSLGNIFMFSFTMRETQIPPKTIQFFSALLFICIIRSLSQIVDKVGFLYLKLEDENANKKN